MEDRIDRKKRKKKRKKESKKEHDDSARLQGGSKDEHSWRELVILIQSKCNVIKVDYFNTKSLYEFYE